MAPHECEVPNGQAAPGAAKTSIGHSKQKSVNLAIDIAAAAGVDSIDREMPDSADTAVEAFDVVETKPVSDDDGEAKPEHAADTVTVDAKPAKASQPTSRTISYHQNADLCIRILDKAGTTHNLKVCSALIAAALPTLGDLSACVDVASSGERILDLDGFQNNHQGLDTILSIIHYKFHEIPARPEIDQLYSIAQVVEKYDCAHLVLPFMEKW
jgi:hypothetical protein